NDTTGWGRETSSRCGAGFRKRKASHWKSFSRTRATAEPGRECRRESNARFPGSTVFNLAVVLTNTVTYSGGAPYGRRTYTGSAQPRDQNQVCRRDAEKDL